MPPTPHEAAWVDSSAERFAELVAALADPTFGSVPFLEWLDRRLVERSATGAATGADASWARLAATEPALADAAQKIAADGPALVAA